MLKHGTKHKLTQKRAITTSRTSGQRATPILRSWSAESKQNNTKIKHRKKTNRKHKHSQAKSNSFKIKHQFEQHIKQHRKQVLHHRERVVNMQLPDCEAEKPT